MTLRDIIINYLDSKDDSSHSFRRLWNLGTFGMQTEFGLDVKANIKTAVIDVNPNKTIALPCDFISLSKVGVLNHKGEVVTFKVNNNLTTYHQEYFDSTTRLSGLPTIPTYGFLGVNGGYGYNSLLYLNYWYSGTSYNLFGLGSGTVDVGEYKLDDYNKIMLFNPQCFHWEQVVLEYLTDGADESGDYPVDIKMAAAVKAYLRWADVVDRPKKASPNEVKQLFFAYNNEKRKARMRINPVILNEMQNAERRSWKLVPKA